MELTLFNPYVRGNVTKLKMVLPIGKERVWNLIAKTEGISSWLTIRCGGEMVVGRLLKCRWLGPRWLQLKVIYMGEKHSSFRLRREDGTEVRFYLHGRMTTLTLEVHYSRTAEGRKRQISELPLWAFSLANLKSVALDRIDLRHNLSGRTAENGFIDWI